MTVANWLSLLFGSGVLVSIIKYVRSNAKINELKTEALCLGVQALLRDRLNQAYYHYAEKGYAPMYAKENFENMYKQYHNLGLNGVMDDTRKKFLELPTTKKEDNEE